MGTINFGPTSLLRKPERIKAQERHKHLYMNMDPGLKSSLWTSTSSSCWLPPLRRWSASEFPTRSGKIGPTRWASPVSLELGRGWSIKLLAQKKPGQIWPDLIWPGPVWPGLARPARIFFFFALKRLFSPTRPVFREGWAVKILARKNPANFVPTWFWPGPLLARPSPARPA